MLAWSWRTIVVMVLYGSVNVKRLTRYDSIVLKSCEVTLSLFYFPTGNHPKSLNGVLSNELLRNATARYFSKCVRRTSARSLCDLFFPPCVLMMPAVHLCPRPHLPVAIP